MSYRQISYYTDKPILSNKDILYLYVVKKPMSGHSYSHFTDMSQKSNSTSPTSTHLSEVHPTYDYWLLVIA